MGLLDRGIVHATGVYGDAEGDVRGGGPTNEQANGLLNAPDPGALAENTTVRP